VPLPGAAESVSVDSLRWRAADTAKRWQTAGLI
jgi:hypothetical protein